MPKKLTRYMRFSRFARPREIHFARAALVGSLAGAIAVFFQMSLSAAEKIRIDYLNYFSNGFVPGWILLALFSGACGCLAGWLTVSFAPEATGSGIPHVKAVLMHLRVMRWRSLIPVKFFGGMLAIAGGFSLGREGPTVQLGAAVGAGLAEKMNIPRRHRSHLIACGAGAGLAAAFNAPLAGFIFVIEELRREFSPVTYGTALIAAVMADVITRATLGSDPSFAIRDIPTPTLSAFPYILLLGLLAGLIGVGFQSGLIAGLNLVDRIRPILPRWSRAACVGLIVGLVGWFIPQTMGPGHNTVESFNQLGGENIFGIPFLCLLFCLKFLLLIICYCSGVPGGIFAPLLTLGAILGIVLGELGKAMAIPFVATPAAMAVVGMASLLSAVVRAPLTAVILIVEMTANYELLFFLLTACMVSYLVAAHFECKPIYETLLDYNLRRRGPQASSDTEPVILDVGVEVSSAMDGAHISELHLPEGCLLVTIDKAGRELVPSGRTILRAGDQLTIILSGDIPKAARQILEQARAPA